MKKLLLALALLAATGPTQAPAQPAPSTAAKPAAPPAPPTTQLAPLQPGQSVTDKHPYAVYFILIAASLAAVASLASSSITAWVTWKSKDKEYKNDYYKKVIDKRMKAIERAEALLALFSTSSKGNNEKIGVHHSYFKADFKTTKFSDAIGEAASFAAWYSREAEAAIRAFTELVLSVINEGRKIEDDEKRLIFFASKLKVISAKKVAAEEGIANDMRTLYDVDAFFNSRFGNNNLADKTA